ncbi:hypothetical protein [Pedobacter sp. MW01-1-1]|uniref:hypothetical protein n=1 Tax=Pedobacter sp. MW01-1-1 TaxID=3383027 RepID=UPI003FF014EF
MYSVVSGELLNGVLYTVAGEQSVVYNGATYSAGQSFRATSVKTFTYSGAGTQLLYEVTEITGFALELVQDPADAQFEAAAPVLYGFALEFELNDADKVFNETTEIKGFALELVDFPIFVFNIITRRL